MAKTHPAEHALPPKGEDNGPWINLERICRKIVFEKCRAPDGDNFVMCHIADYRNGRFSHQPISTKQIDTLLRILKVARKHSCKRAALKPTEGSRG